MKRSWIALAAAFAAAPSLTRAQNAAQPQKKQTEGQRIMELIRKARPQLVKGPAISYSVLPERTIFPSYVIAGATIRADEAARPESLLGDFDGMIGIGVSSIAEYTAISVTVSCDEVMEPSTFKGFLPKANVTYAVMPKIKWKYGQLLKSRQQMPLNLVFKVKLGVLEEVEHTETCTLRSINDCPLGFVVGDVLVSTHWAFAAYVNEDHPWVDGILKDALATGVVKSFTGYQTGKEDDVLTQIYAIWRVLQTRGISYSDISKVSAQGETVFSQHVRFLDECITNKQANCIDGTVMIASVLRKIGINSSIVFVPGHAFLAIDMDRAGNNAIGLETTIIGKAKKEDFDRVAKLKEALEKQQTFEEASWNSFSSAVKVGSTRYQKELPKLTRQVAATPDYSLISLARAREIGVRPIPYGSGSTPGAGTGPETKTPERVLNRVR